MASFVFWEPQTVNTVVGDTVRTAVDTARAGSAPEETGNLFTHLLKHVQDAHELDTPFGRIDLPHLTVFGVDMSITKHVVFLWLAAILLIVGLALVARKNKKSSVPTGIGNLVEVFIVFVRDEIAVSSMGPAGLAYLPYLLTTFFFILLMNLFGLVPYGASATGNVSVTAGLAVIAYVVIQLSALRAQGLSHYLAHFTGGVHWILWPIMIPIEILGTFTKAFALCIRLFANMTGGHIVIVSLIGLIFIFGKVSPALGYSVSVPSVLLIVGINMLELFVAFLQAYIFTVITALLMGLQMEKQEHAPEGGHAH
ncbi:MAG TPA: F0F1 ATP synthase subunit A [Bacteroidota bacterium]|nr:F0F1 ATP synthase subunit A [Bacteroidota bacterium]